MKMRKDKLDGRCLNLSWAVKDWKSVFNWWREEIIAIAERMDERVSEALEKLKEKDWDELVNEVIEAIDLCLPEIIEEKLEELGFIEYED